MFLSRNKKNNVYPCKPQFYYVKVGFKWGGGGGKIMLAEAVLTNTHNLCFEQKYEKYQNCFGGEIFNKIWP